MTTAGQQHSGGVPLGGNQFLSYCLTHMGQGIWHGWYQLPGEKVYRHMGLRGTIVGYLRRPQELAGG